MTQSNPVQSYGLTSCHIWALSRYSYCSCSGNELSHSRYRHWLLERKKKSNQNKWMWLALTGLTQFDRNKRSNLELWLNQLIASHRKPLITLSLTFLTWAKNGSDMVWWWGKIGWALPLHSISHASSTHPPSKLSALGQTNVNFGGGPMKDDWRWDIFISGQALPPIQWPRAIKINAETLEIR